MKGLGGCSRVMSKLYIQNLGLIITDRCNLKCKHCLRGGSFSKDMSNEVIAATLDQVNFINTLCICGGEVTLAIPTLEKVLTYVVDNRIPLECVSATINGTVYSEELLRLFDYVEEYISSLHGGKDNVIFGISKDVFHEDEVLRLGMKEQFVDNLKKYINSPYFYGFREIDRKLFREGRAVFLDESLTVPLRPYPVVYSYLQKKKVCAVGPLITINTDGIITECDASIENQEKLYNYGNVLDASLEDICTKIGTEVHPLLWYRKTEKILKKQWSYEK